MKNISKKGILMVMSNANGWRNPKVFGGAEIETISIINKIENFDWYIILPYPLYDIFFTSSSGKLHYLPIKTLFSKTNIMGDLLQGLVYTWKSVMIGWKNRKRFNLIYSATTNFSDIFPAKIISLITNKPYVVKYHISIYNEAKILKIYKNFREEKNSVLDSFIRAILARITIHFLKGAQGVLIVCKYLGIQLEGCGIEKSKILLNYNGIDFKKLSKFRDESLVKKYDICCIGRIEKNKGMQDLVDVVKELKKKKQDILAIVIGDGSFLEDLKNSIKENDLGKNIVTTGFLGDERYKLLQQSRVFVSPTYAKEGFGLTLLEVLFFDVPIISYTNNVLEEVFGRYESVHLISQEKKLLQNSIEKLLKEREPCDLPDLDVYSLENCAAREREILSGII